MVGAGIIKTGPWASTISGLARFGKTTRETNSFISLRAAKLAERLVVKNIRAGGALVGAPFTANKESTILRKGSSKPLIDNADLLNSISSKRLNSTQAIAGVLKAHPSGHNIGLIHEEGATGTGRARTGIIPARPFLAPVAKSRKLQTEIEEMAEREYAKMVKNLFS